jgi:hypothetical protein
MIATITNVSMTNQNQTGGIFILIWNVSKAK